MALMFLRVILLGVLAVAAADDVPITWFSGQRMSLPCTAPHAERLQLRRPPPPLEGDERPRARSYMWRRGDEEISPKRVLPSGGLEVTRRRDGEGVYQCLVRHHGGLVLGYPVHLKFASIEKQFSSHPENATARSRQPFSVSCNISSTPEASVSWLKDDLPLPDDDRYYTFQSQLLITDVTPSDSGSYRCVATNTHLNKNRTSHAGTVQVGTSSGTLEPAFLPLAFDGHIYSPRGSRIELPCPVIGWPRPRLVWKLTPPGERTAELEPVVQVFRIPSLQPDQEGVYTCSVEDTNLVKTFKVTLTEPPIITIPPTSKDAVRASTVRFNCTTFGRPEPMVTWYKDGQPLVLAGRINMRKSIDGQRTELVISGVTSDDAGVYQCFASNQAATVSSWATLNVTGADAAAPTNVQCWPLGDRRIKVTWHEPAVGEIVAYTIHGTPVEEKAGNSLPGNPLKNTEENVTVATPLIAYRFQVRAYTRKPKNAVSELSEGAVCQGQGVPIKMAKLNDTAILVSWKSFAEEIQGVVQWILQYRADNTSQERNVTLNGAVYNYTLSASPSSSLQVRLLGSRSEEWLQQDLTLVPWSSTAGAYASIDAGDVIPVPTDVKVSHLTARELIVTWRCDSADERLTYLVCIGKGISNHCQESRHTSATFDNLQPGTEYEIVVQARLVPGSGALSAPILITTPSESPQRFKELSGRFINSSTLKVSWNGAPGKYKVNYSAQLKLPVEQWDSVETNDSNFVLIPGIDPVEKTYLMVTGYDPEEHSNIETIPPLFKDSDAQEPQYEYTRSGVRVWWRGAGRKLVIYSQNITTPMEQWDSIPATEPQVEIVNLDPSSPVYVMVTSNKKQRSQILTINPRPADNSSLYLGVGIGVGVFLLALLALAAVCLWRKRKRAGSPRRHRRRNTGSNEENVEEEAEMKCGGGGGGAGAANGATGRGRGGGGAGRGGPAQPLLNGHVHITENPTSKTPNGKIKKGLRLDAAFDVSRYEDPDATLETVLDADSSASTTMQLLDTSRRPEYDHSRSSRQLSTNNSFAKLPDDNMNSELTSSFQLDNSKILPTLQPNG